MPLAVTLWVNDKARGRTPISENESTSKQAFPHSGDHGKGNSAVRNLGERLIESRAAQGAAVQ